MYTIGTAALRHIASTIDDHRVSRLLRGKLVAFVGSDRDRLRSDQPIHINQYTVFFEVPSTPDGRVIHPITEARVWDTRLSNEGTDYPQWIWVQDRLIRSEILLTHLRSASGFNPEHRATARGNIADIGAVPKIDGLQFYAKDTQELYIYDSQAGDWKLLTSGIDRVDVDNLILISESNTNRIDALEKGAKSLLDRIEEVWRRAQAAVTPERIKQAVMAVLATVPLPSGGGVPVGSTIGWGTSISYPVPTGFLRCNGDTLRIAEWPELFTVITTLYGGSAATGYFMLPNEPGRLISAGKHLDIPPVPPAPIPDSLYDAGPGYSLAGRTLRFDSDRFLSILENEGWYWDTIESNIETIMPIPGGSVYMHYYDGTGAEKTVVSFHVIPDPAGTNGLMYYANLHHNGGAHTTINLVRIRSERHTDNGTYTGVTDGAGWTVPVSMDLQTAPLSATMGNPFDFLNRAVLESIKLS